jgi:hypothetical protein
VEIRRCHRCGTRHSRGEEATRFVFTCDRCGLPFLADELPPHGENRCEPCRRGERIPALPSAAESIATEAEVLDAIRPRWRFVTSDAPAAYVENLLRIIAGKMGGSMNRCRAIFLDEPQVKTFALPAGCVVLSRGALDAVQDEAELVFLLAHELSHAVSGDAAVSLGRMGFRATARHGATEDGEGWASAASDLVLLGYGRRRETDADARAVEAMVALDYDPHAALRLLARIDIRVRAGDPLLESYATAHPPAADRMRRLERALYGRLAEGVGKVNREVFRRVTNSVSWFTIPGPQPEQAQARADADPGHQSTAWFRFWGVAAVVGGLALLAIVVLILLG